MTSTGLHVGTALPNAWPQQFLTALGKIPQPFSSIILDSKSRTMWLKLLSSFACWGRNMAPSLNYIHINFLLLMVSFDAKFSFSFTGWKLSWMRSCPQGATPFISFNFRPAIKLFISLSTGLDSNILLRTNHLLVLFFSLQIGHFMFFFVSLALFHCRCIYKWSQITM